MMMRLPSHDWSSQTPLMSLRLPYCLAGSANRQHRSSVSACKFLYGALCAVVRHQFPAYPAPTDHRLNKNGYIHMITNELKVTLDARRATDFAPARVLEIEIGRRLPAIQAADEKT